MACLIVCLIVERLAEKYETDIFWCSFALPNPNASSDGSDGGVRVLKKRFM
jgi:hypothetical protein